METTEYRSKMMKKIRSTGGKAETILAKLLYHKGIRYRKNFKDLPGKPDIAITKYKIAVFIDGEFWHGYDWSFQKNHRIHTHRDYWIPKIEKNMARDVKVTKKLENMGWIVIRFWEKHDVLKNPTMCRDIILKYVYDRKYGN